MGPTPVVYPKRSNSSLRARSLFRFTLYSVATSTSSVAVTSGEVAPEQTVAEAAGPEATAAAETSAQAGSAGDGATENTES